MSKNANTNWRAMQVATRIEDKAGHTSGRAWLKQGDVNVKAMSMGSWHANSRNGGARSRGGK
jgi:hypothetical protein